MRLTKQRFLKLLTSADNETLMMSRKNCHAANVSSIVLKNDGGRLTRVFMAWPGHRLVMNAVTTGAFEVGVHNHRYDIMITPFIGYVFNETYEEGGRESFDYYEFRSGVKSGEFQAKRLGGRYLRHCKSEYLALPVFMEAEELHTISALPCHAAWMVEEGKVTRDWTSLYTNVPVKQQPGMYSKFESPDAVRDHCIKFLFDSVKPMCHHEKHPSLGLYEPWERGNHASS